MVSTRKSTGSLPPPRLKSLAKLSIDDDDEEWRLRKGAKTGRNSKQRGKTAAEIQQVGEYKDKPDVKASENACKVLINKPGRINSLITGAKSKSATAGNVRNGARKDRIKKADLGKLEKVMDLSVEVFYEIAILLMPNDLLNLSRTSRSLRAFLMSRASRALWIACFASIGFPPCPSDMSDPQYANLFFEKDCHACGHPRVERLSYQLRVRLCKGCAQLNVVRGMPLLREKLGADACKNYEIYTLLPWNGFDDNDIYSVATVSKSAQYRSYLKFDFLEIIDAYMETGPGLEERKSLVARQHELLREIAKNIRDVKIWKLQQNVILHKTKRLACERRKEQITEKLVSIGYTKDDIESMWSVPYWQDDIREDWEQLLEQPRELTDRAWKNIQQKLIRSMKKKKEYDEREAIIENRRKREDELLALYKEYVERHQMDKMDTVPLCFTDLLEVEFVKNLIEENECEIELNAGRWSNIVERLPIIHRDHSLRVEHDCLDLLLAARRKAAVTDELERPAPMRMETKATSTDRTIDLSALRSASTFFLFRHTTVTYEEFLSCWRRMMLRPADFDCQAWGYNGICGLAIDVHQIRVANALSLSLNWPKDTTMKHAMSLGKVFVCQQCDPVLRKRMTWLELSLHFCTELDNYRRTHISNPEAPLLETHKLEPDVGPLAVIDHDFVEHPTDSFTYIYDPGSGAQEVACTSCQKMFITVKFLYKEQYEAHARAYHCPNFRLRSS